MDFPLGTIFLIVFSLPIFSVVALFVISFYFFIVKSYHKLNGTYSEKIWHQPMRNVANFWNIVGNIWHGHEVIGLENIPQSGPALVLFYHSPMIIDFLYFHSAVSLQKSRVIKVVCDKFFFHIPGFGSMLEGSQAIWGPFERCESLLEQGNILAISPGGAREAFFSDNNYGLLWGHRTGFARLATQAKVPVIPIFTENCREALSMIPFYKLLFTKLYEITRWPLIFTYGFLPVKMRTYVGEPIEFDESRSAEELKALAKLKMEELIAKNQRLPGNTFYALLDRFTKRKIE